MKCINAPFFQFWQICFAIRQMHSTIWRDTFDNVHKYEMHWCRRITDGQKVSVFCVCGGALSLVGRNNKSAGKGSTNIQQPENTNTKYKQKFNTKVQTYNDLKIQIQMEIEKEIQTEVHLYQQPTYNTIVVFWVVILVINVVFDDNVWLYMTLFCWGGGGVKDRVEFFFLENSSKLLDLIVPN